MPVDQRVIDLAEKIVAARDSGTDASDLLVRFEAMVPYPNARELFISDVEAVHIATRAASFSRIPAGEGRREKLIELVRRIQNFEGGELAVDIAWDCFASSVPHPEPGSVLAQDLSPEEIVDEALSYRAILLGG